MRKIQTSRLISLLLGTVLTFSTAITAYAADYNDVSDSVWYRTAVDFVTEKNLMGGTGSGDFEPETPRMRFLDNISIEKSTKPTVSASLTEPEHPAVTIPAQSEEYKMINMNITIGNATFKAKMYDNKTIRALITQMPMTVNMSELNGQEKYYHFQSGLPVESTEAPATIHAGEPFSNSYGGYTKLGYTEDISGLTAVLGTGAVQVTFSIND